MKILITSGIWPPDVGGPASHAPELAAFLARKGHDVSVVGVADAPQPQSLPFSANVLARESRLGSALVRTTAAVARAARGRDVVYSAGLYTRTTAMAAALNVPLVLKLASDPAYERSSRRGWFGGTLEEFQSAPHGSRVRYLIYQRHVALSRAARILVPSRYLADIAAGWGLPASRLRVIPNPSPQEAVPEERDALRRRFGILRPTVVFVGRLVQQKNVGLAVRALQYVDDADLAIVGDGPKSTELRRLVLSLGLEDRVRMIGTASRRDALGWLRAADAAVLPSAWENLPHVAVEAISVGTPVVATDVGGVSEVVTHEQNGLLVPAGDERQFAQAVATVLDPAVGLRLRDGAMTSRLRFLPDHIYGEVEEELGAATL